MGFGVFLSADLPLFEDLDPGQKVRSSVGFARARPLFSPELKENRV